MGPAKTGERVILVARDAERGSRLEQEIRSQVPDADTELVLSDLSSLSSVRNATAVIKSKQEKIDVLINNAGVYKRRREFSRDGLELMVVTNHIGQFLLMLRIVKPKGDYGRFAVSWPGSVAQIFQHASRGENLSVQ